MKRKSILAVLLGLAIMTMSVGCSSQSTATSTKKQLNVGFAIKTQDSPYFVSLVNTVKKLGKAEGWNITVLDANGDTSQETKNVETFISQKMDLIFLDSVDPDACIPVINEAADAKIGVINLDSGVGKGAKDITTVYSDNKQNGRLVGLAYAKKMGSAKIISILLSGAKGNVAGYERRTGVFAGIIQGKTGVTEAEAWKAADAFDVKLLANGKATDAAANFSVVGQGWGKWTREDGLKAAEDLITANPKITTVIGENDQMLFGAMTGLKNANIKGVDIVAAADGAKEAYKLIQDGQYFATGENSPVKVATLGIKIAKDILVNGKDKGSYPAITMTTPNAVTKANVAKFYDVNSDF